MLVSALSILSYVVLSPELSGDPQTDEMVQQRANKPGALVKPPELKVEELLNVSKDASDSCLWSLLNVLSSLLDAVAMRHPTHSSASVTGCDTHSTWELLKNRCFQAIKRCFFVDSYFFDFHLWFLIVICPSCALRFDMLVASSDSVALQHVKSLTEDNDVPLSVLFPSFSMFLPPVCLIFEQFSPLYGSLVLH
jgi:hypothetical protein